MRIYIYIYIYIFILAPYNYLTPSVGRIALVVGNCVIFLYFSIIPNKTNININDFYIIMS